jgi:hypothetical protein
MQDLFRREIDRVAEIHFFLRPLLNNSLKNHPITPEGQMRAGGFDNYFDYWHDRFGDRFFDMATIIRLGTVIENCLKYYYMKRKGHATLIDLKADPKYKPNIFQRIQSNQTDNALKLYKDELGYDLNSNPHLKEMQEAMAHRHLYAHNSGLIDEKYINDIKRITRVDISTHPDIASSYPNQDVYWFEPLKRLDSFIEGAKNFFGQFP